MAILIIDDDRDYRDSLRMVLESAGHSVVGAATAKEALKSLANGDISLMLVDYIMPEMNGEEFLKSVWSDSQWPPALLITGVSPRQTAGLLELGVGYLRKPVPPGVLLDTVNLMLKKGENGWALNHCQRRS